MKISKTNAILIWKQLEDVLVPRLCLTLAERAVYSHLLRHSRLEDRLRLRFSILWLARGNRLSAGSVRLAVRRLVAKGALRLVERTRAGHVVEVRLPEEIRAVRANGAGPGGPARPRRLTARVRCLDHVVPAVRTGSNSYRNLVSSCAECNSQKGETPAEGFLRLLYRDGRLTAAELTGRLRALEALAAGKLRPAAVSAQLPQ